MSQAELLQIRAFACRRRSCPANPELIKTNFGVCLVSIIDERQRD
jgi:hypothetical protein